MSDSHTHLEFFCLNQPQQFFDSFFAVLFNMPLPTNELADIWRSDERVKLRLPGLRDERRFLAEALFEKLRKGKIDLPMARTLVEVVRAEVQAKFIPDFYWNTRQQTEPKLEVLDFLSVARYIFDEAHSNLNRSIAKISDRAYHGLPMYEKDERGALRMVADDDSRLVFLRESSKMGASFSVHEPPHWMNNLFVKQGDQEAYELFRFRKSLSDEEIAKLRSALRKQLNVEEKLLNASDAKSTESERKFVRRSDVVLLTDATRHLSREAKITLRESVDIVYKSLEAVDSTLQFWKLPLSGGLPEVWEDVDHYDLLANYFNAAWWNEEYAARILKEIGPTKEMEQLRELALLSSDADRMIADLCQYLGSTVQISAADRGYLDPAHSRYSAKLAAAIKVWEAMDDESLMSGMKPQPAMVSWLESRYVELGLVWDGKRNATAIAEVAKIANWDLLGGPPKTPG